MRPSASPASAEILLSHADFVHRLARSLLGDAAAAEDVAQDTLTAAIERPPRHAAGMRRWLSIVTRNFARQRRRSERRRMRREAAAVEREAAPSAAQVHEREALRARVVEAVLALPESYREVVLLRYYEDRPPRAIAAALQLPVETVRTRLKRGQAQLRQRLENDAEVRGGLARALLLLVGRGAAPLAISPLLAVIGMRGAAACVLAALAMAGLWLARPLATSPPHAPTAPSPVAADAAPGDAPVQRQELAAPPESHMLAGHVLAPDGSAIADVALVYCSSDGPAPAGIRPMPLGEATRLRRRDGSLAVRFSEVGGAFRFDLGERERAWVEVLAAGATLPPPGAWHLAAEADIELRLQPAPTANVQVRAERGGQPVTGFSVEAVRAGGMVFPTRDTDGQVLELSLPLTSSGDGDEFELRARSPARARTSVRLRSGQLLQAVLQLPPGGAVEGIVVDAGGTPVADALVYFGTFESLRGDEPFKPFKPRRVRDGVRTDALGHFRLDGPGERITVFAPHSSPVTVARDAAPRIVLPELGVIAGRLVDPSGRPRPDILIALDRERPVSTDANGSFRFDGVYAGVRGLCLPGGQFVGVRVDPGQTAQVEIGRDLVDVRIILHGIERATLHPEGVVLVGLEPVFGVAIGKVEGEVLPLPQARPGRYWLLSRDEPIAMVELQTRNAEVTIGDATLTVHGAPGARVTLVPEGAHELLRILASRPQPRAIGPEGTLAFHALPAGAYELVDADGGRVWPLQVSSPAVELRLR